MIPVLTKEQAYMLDKDTIESGHLTQEELMDNAGKGVAQFFCENIDDPFNQKVLVVCGKGNNGGDGVVAHSYLKSYNVSSKIIFTDKNHGHLKLIKKHNISENDYSIYSKDSKLDKYDWVIDGVFGIGLSRKLDAKYKKIINEMSVYRNIISIDVPSGMFVDATANISLNVTVSPMFTLSIGFPKIGNYFFGYRENSNNIRILDIGFNKIVRSNFFLISKMYVKKIIKKVDRKLYKNKYDSGVSIIAGSNKYPGAAILACNASFKSGAGYVSLNGDFDSKTANIIKQRTIESVLNNDKQWFPNILIGPGLNKDYKIPNISDQRDLKINCVLDASALYSGNVNLDSIKYNNVSFIRTPHKREFFKMFNLKDDFYSLQSLIEIAQNNTFENDITILKGPSTFIITNDKVYIIDNGPSILATAGTGDVLSGMIVSLLSQGYSSLDASVLGVYLHAEAANYHIDNISKDGMTASDLINCIPHAFNKLREHNVN